MMKNMHAKERFFSVMGETVLVSFAPAMLLAMVLMTAMIG